MRDLIASYELQQFESNLQHFGDRKKAAVATVAGPDGRRIVDDAVRVYGEQWTAAISDSLRAEVWRATGVVLD